MMSKGFTLIELLVAITVLAIVAVLGWRGLDTIVRARTTLNADLEQARGLQLAFAQMQSDAGQVATPAAIGARPALAAQADRLMLVRFVFAENQPSRLQVVSYRVRDGKLTRSESLPTRDLKELDTAWTAATGDASAIAAADVANTSAVTLHSNVSAMAIRLWQQDVGWRPAGSPAPTAPVGMPLTPSGVEVSLQLRDREANLVKIFLVGAA
jgi:general secretion pathway protein J